MPSYDHENKVVFAWGCIEVGHGLLLGSIPSDCNEFSHRFQYKYHNFSVIVPGGGGGGLRRNGPLHNSTIE